MSTKWFEDYIPALVQVNSTSIKLPSGGHITLGGKQYHLTSDIFATLPTLAACTLYMVYFVNGGSPSLVVSTNVNSVGPAGYSTFKLVGAFYANGLTSVGFGSFVNLNGTPTTKWMGYTPSITSLSGTVVNYTTNFNYRRTGSTVYIKGEVSFTGASGTWVQFRFSPPVATVITPAEGAVGFWNTLDAGVLNYGLGYVWEVGNGTLGLRTQSDGGTNRLTGTETSSTSPFTFSTGDFIYICEFPLAVPTWSETPIQFL
jgi:hypothetical protein